MLRELGNKQLQGDCLMNLGKSFLAALLQMQIKNSQKQNLLYARALLEMQIRNS